MEKGSSEENLLEVFRQEGASMMESVKLIKQMKSISLSEAQNLVHLSAVWNDCKESHEELQETFADVLLKISQDNLKEPS